MNIITHHYSGKSLKELKAEFGIGLVGFFDQSWYENESFYTEKAETGDYTIELHYDLNNLLYQEQLKKMGKTRQFLHPAILAEAILTHYRKTGERLMESWYSRTNVVIPDGYRIYVGYFDSYGLHINYWSDDRPDCNVGLVFSRKLKKEI